MIQSKNLFKAQKMRRFLSLLLLCLAFSVSVMAQTPTVKGQVVDAKGEPLTGVTVKVKGTKNAVLTDIDGNYSIPAPKGSVLEFSYVGFTPQEQSVKGTLMNISMSEDSKNIDEIVVTALGIKREQKALSYNVQKLDGDKLTTVKDANFVNSLNGKVAGVTINASAAGAGGAVRVIMRGNKSLEKDNNALYVIDGIPMFNVNTGDTSGGTMTSAPGTSSAADINPEDIESMSVLTGPAAAALYGYEAANGVILINTKKGTEGKMKISYSNNTSFSGALMMPQFQNTYGNITGENVSWGSKLATPTTYDPSDFFNTGVNEINGLTFSVGNAHNQTFASISTTNTTGILPNNSYNRYNFSVRNTTKFCQDKLTLDVGAQYIIQNNKNMVGSGQYYNPLTSLYLFPRGESFEEVQMYERYDEARNIMTQYWPAAIYGSEIDMQNPYWIMNRMNNSANKRRYMFNVSLKWDITSWAYVTGRVRVDNSDMDSYQKFYASTNPTFTEGSSKGYYGHSKQNDRTFYGDVMASVNKYFFEDRLSLNAQLGASLNDQREDVLRYNGGLLTIPNFFHEGNVDTNTSKIGETAWHDQTQSVFASAELGWQRMLYLTLTGRNDWASMLAYTTHGSFFYPSVGLSGIISEMVKMPSFIDYLKVRASWAMVGSAPSRWLTLAQYTYNEQTKTYEYPSTYYDRNLKPEDTKSWELGLNTKLFGNRLNLDVTLYRSNTYNQTFSVTASKSSGYSYVVVQSGNIQNQGVELGVGYNDHFGKVDFSTNITYSVNQNKIIRLANGEINPQTGKAIEMEYFAKGTLGTSGGPEIRLYEGGTLGDIYTNHRLRQSPNGYIWVDPTTGNVEMEQTEYTKVGSILPKFHLGWSGNIAYRGFNLGFTFTGRFGGLVVSDTQATLDKYGVSQATADARDNGGIWINNGYVSARNYYETISQAPGTYYMYSATNIRLSELSLTYTMPRKWFRNKLGMTLGLTAKNLWMIYCKAPFDPESTSSVSNTYYQGVDYFQQPSLRTVGFNLKINY